MTEVKVGDDTGYVVVFRHTEAAGGYDGVITWTVYPSRQGFEEAQKYGFPQLEVIAKGVTTEEAIQLTRKTPILSRVAAAVDDATGPDGRVRLDALNHGLENLKWARRFGMT